MNYEAETRKPSTGKLRSSFYWIFYNSREAKETARSICVLFIILAGIITTQFLMTGAINKQIDEWETGTISKWRVVGKFVDDTYRENRYYLVLQNDKYKWAKKVTNVGYNITNVGSTISIEYTKSDLFPENKPDYLAIIGFISIAFQVLLLIGIFICVADFLDKEETDYHRFCSWIISNNGIVSRDDPRVQNQFDKYISRYSLLKALVSILMIGSATWCTYYLILICKTA